MVDSGNPEGSSWADQLPEAPVEEVDNRSALESIPGWFWLLTVGIITIAVGSVAIRLQLAEQEVLRGRIALGQLAIGLISMMVAHGIAAKFAMANDRRISIPDIFLAWFNIWQPTISRLPGTCRRLLALIWGMIAVLTAVTIIGGIDYGYPFRDHQGVDLKPMNVVNAVASAARAQAAKDNEEKTLEEAVSGDQLDAVASGVSGDEMSMEDAINELGDMDEKLMEQMDGVEMPQESAESEETDESQVSESRKELLETLNRLPADEQGIRRVEAAVYGVVLNERNVPTGLMFAVRHKDNWVHLCHIDQPGIPGRIFARIVQKLNGKLASQPFIEQDSLPEAESIGRVAWVKQQVLCRLGYAEAEKGELTDGHVESILISHPAELDSL